MTVTWKGVIAGAGISPVKTRRTRTPENGWQTVITYMGPWANIEAAKNNPLFIQFSTRIEVEQNGPAGTMEVYFASESELEQPPQNDEDSNVWVLAPWRDEKNIEQHPNFAWLAGIPGKTGHIQRIIAAVERYKERVATGIAVPNAEKDLVFNLSDYIEYKESDDLLFTPAAEQAAFDLAQLLIAGHTTFSYDRYALENRKVVPAASNITASHTAVNHQWSTLKILEEIASGTVGVTQANIIGDIANTFPNNRWLKQAPTITALANGKFEIQTLWVKHEDLELPTLLHPTYG